MGRLRLIYFSATGATKALAEDFVGLLGSDYTHLDITHPIPSLLNVMSENDTAVIAVPVYAGRVPKIAAQRLKSFDGKHCKCICLCVFGNRAYDDALLELCDIAAERNFNVISAGAFVARHSIFPNVAANRPDFPDRKLLQRFALLSKQRINGESKFDISNVPGNRPYKKTDKIPFYPQLDKNRCTACATCVEECPVGAISNDNLTADKDKCISCARCISICRHRARRFSGITYKSVSLIFSHKCARPVSPEWF
ncbi:MAG: 4Fe-4S binding protein [Prevotella sp.]|nr:4Fe-4S binding protein [Bacteroides sp.]MCM1366027.1 4Fe-4S binding protein [Prevotella sp.]MCM1436903.1 4Fe-4S binding protein [Prevotella sp.]